MIVVVVMLALSVTCFQLDNSGFALSALTTCLISPLVFVQLFRFVYSHSYVFINISVLYIFTGSRGVTAIYVGCGL